MKYQMITLVSLAMLMILTSGVILTSKSLQKNQEKKTQFECGFNQMTPNTMTFSFQFFLVAILFLIFDVEISLILSYPLEKMSSKSIFMMTIFLSTLTLALLYEWQKNKIKWSKWEVS